jgi:hypothetical protein
MIKLLHRDPWQERDITFHYKFSAQPASKLCTPQSDKQGANSRSPLSIICNPLALFDEKFYTGNCQITISHTTSTTASASSTQS